METKLKRIAEVAKACPDEKFTSLIHLINEETIKKYHREMSTKKTSGIDEVTKEEYDANLDEDLINRMKRQAYKPLPVKRVYIPKPGTNKQGLSVFQPRNSTGYNPNCSASCCGNEAQE